MFARLRSFAVRGINLLLSRPDVVDVTNPNGDRYIGTTRAWGCTGQRYTAGAVVPHLRRRSTYSVATTDRVFINVAQGRIASWSRKPVMDTVADLYGRVRIAPARGRR